MRALAIDVYPGDDLCCTFSDLTLNTAFAFLSQQRLYVFRRRVKHPLTASSTSGTPLNRACRRCHQLHLLHLPPNLSGGLDTPGFFERGDVVLDSAASKSGGLDELVRVRGWVRGAGGKAYMWPPPCDAALPV